jgi:hypothetical protein
MTPMELCVGSVVGLMIFNPANIGIYIPMLAVAAIGFLYIE